MPPQVGPLLYRSVLRSVQRLAGPCGRVKILQPVNPGAWGHGDFSVAPTQPALLYLFGLPPAFAEESETVGSSPESLADGFTAPVLNKLARRCFEREVLASADDSVIERTHAGFAVLRLLGHPEHGKQGFVYRVTVENTGTTLLRVNGRHWIIEEDGHEQEMVPHGSPGIVGHTPVLRPGDCFVYSSGTIIESEEAAMRGSLQVEYGTDSEDGAFEPAGQEEEKEGEGGASAEFDALIAPFKLLA